MCTARGWNILEKVKIEIVYRYRKEVAVLTDQTWLDESKRHNCVRIVVENHDVL